MDEEKKLSSEDKAGMIMGLLQDSDKMYFTVELGGLEWTIIKDKIQAVIEREV